MYNNLLLYYFSGTGNARRSAEWIAEYAKTRGLNTQLVNIDRFEKIEVPALEGKTLVGFCSPTHGFNLPPIMLEFIWKFPRIANAHAFILNTRAGLKMGKIFVPGLSGIAWMFAVLVLWIKGFSIRGIRPVDLPSNWISLHPGVRQPVVVSMHEHWYKKVQQFAARILDGKRSYHLWTVWLDILVSPISIGYYFVGRFMIAKTFIATDACTKCGLCEKQCPVNAIKNSATRPYWKLTCESCMRCMNQCPERAIETCHGYTALLWWVLAALAYPYILDLCLIQTGVSNITGSWFWVVDNLFLILFSFIAVISGYYLMYFMMRFRWFNKLITYTSLTKYKFWRRYKPARHFTGTNKEL